MKKQVLNSQNFQREQGVIQSTLNDTVTNSQLFFSEIVCIKFVHSNVKKDIVKTILEQIDLSQKQINAHRPFDPATLQHIKEYYRIRLTYTSNALEGNSLTETETKIVLEDGITIGGKRLVEHLEAVGHAEAFDALITQYTQKNITEELIKLFHHLFYFRIDEKNAGVYRTVKTYITGSKYALPEPDEAPHLMHTFIADIKQLRSTVHPVIFAAQLHKQFIFIYPFIDGNGRVARLLMNFALLQAGYTIAIIPPIMRHEYFRSLEKAHVDDTDFIMCIARSVKETQQDYVRLFG